MTDVITGNLLPAPASAAPALPNKEAVEGRALIAYRSILDDYGVAVSASSTASGFAAVNVKSRLTHSGWKPAAGGTQYLYFYADSGKRVAYLGIAAHNLASMGAVIEFEYSDDGSTWIPVLGGYLPDTDRPILLTFTALERLRYRLAVTIDADRYPTLGVVMLGELLALQRGIYVNHRPAPFQRQVTRSVARSDGGNILGSAVVRKAFENEVSLRRITPAWYRAYLDDFLEAATELQYFFLWNTDARYSREVFFGEMTSTPTPVNEHQSFMGVDWSQAGLA